MARFGDIVQDLRHLRIKTIGAILVIVLAVVVAGTVATSLSTLREAGHMEATWRAYDKGAAAKTEILSDLRGALGYGGVIHKFKNFILRQDRLRIIAIQARLLDVSVALTAYKALGVNPREGAALATIDATLRRYLGAVAVAERMASVGAASHEIDRAVKIDDAPAVQAMEALEAELRVARTRSAQQVYESVVKVERFVYLGLAVTGVLVGFVIVSTLWFFRARLVNPLLKLAAAMEELAAGSYAVEIPEVGRGDEIGAMARTVQVFKEHAIRRREAEDELRQAQDQLIRKERLATLGQLSATVSHELRNPLGTIRNSIYTLSRRLEDGGAQISKTIGRLERNIGRCDKIIDEMLDYARETTLDLTPTPVNAWLAEVFDECEMPRGIRLETDFGDVGLEMDLDKDRMRQVIVNLVDNACQAMTGDETGRNGDNRLIVSSAMANGDFVLSLADNGPGIEADTLARIFEPLFSTKTFGVGLGLPIVKRIVESHGGDIDIDSATGRGTTVRICLPMKTKPGALEA